MKKYKTMNCLPTLDILWKKIIEKIRNAKEKFVTKAFVGLALLCECHMVTSILYNVGVGIREWINIEAGR